MLGHAGMWGKHRWFLKGQEVRVIDQDEKYVEVGELKKNGVVGEPYVVEMDTLLHRTKRVELTISQRLKKGGN